MDANAGRDAADARRTPNPWDRDNIWTFLDRGFSLTNQAHSNMAKGESRGAEGRDGNVAASHMLHTQNPE